MTFVFIYDNMVSERQVNKKKKMNKAYKIDFMNFKYKNMDIMYNFYGEGEYSVQYCGDDYIFKTEKEAEIFIDSLDK